MEKRLWRETAGNETDTEQARERREQRFDGESEEEVVGKKKQHQVLIKEKKTILTGKLRSFAN